jgi:hypothetical protein
MICEACQQNGTRCMYVWIVRNLTSTKTHIMWAHRRMHHHGGLRQPISEVQSKELSTVGPLKCQYMFATVGIRSPARPLSLFHPKAFTFTCLPRVFVPPRLLPWPPKQSQR